MLPALDPLAMPEFGSRLPDALERAEKLLQSATGSHGQILLIGDGVDPADVEALKSLREKSAYPLTVIGVGTEAGALIPIPEQGLPQTERHNYHRKLSADEFTLAKMRRPMYIPPYAGFRRSPPGLRQCRP